jgi:hypothetical protein
MESTSLRLTQQWHGGVGLGVVIRMRLLGIPQTGLALARRLEPLAPPRRR